jgi:hypothetical protein
MQGREIDMDKLMSQNELTPAVGNAKVNARGDKLGPGGKIIQKREDIIAEYYENNPKAIHKTTKAPSVQPIVTEEPAPAPAPASAKTKKSQTEE